MVETTTIHDENKEKEAGNGPIKKRNFIGELLFTHGSQVKLDFVDAVGVVVVVDRDDDGAGQRMFDGLKIPAGLVQNRFDAIESRIRPF